MSISAIVPVWNGRDLLARLLASLDTQTLRAEELLVIDNGSEDGAPELARQAGARVIAMGRNAGFAAAVNRGIAESRGDWIAVLNTDVELAPDYFEKLVAANAWFATGKILRTGTNQIDGTFDLVCRGGTAWRAGNGRSDGPAFSEARTIDSAPWTAALFRAELFGHVGILEESFESYLEDVDFGMKCAFKGIYPGRYVPDAIAWHRGSATLGRWHPDTVRRIARNQVLLLKRYYPRETLRRWWWPIAVAHALWGFVALRHGAGSAWLRGEVEGLRRFSSTASYFVEPVAVERVLREGERTIREIQEITGFDTYWKLYFLLTGGGAK
jgi:GT2 family glycosyltransferase